MPKTKMKVVDIVPEPNKNGIVIYRVFVESNGKRYQFGARETHYLDDKSRKSIHQSWAKIIIEDQMPELPDLEKKRIKKEREKKRSALIGMEMDEDE